MVSMTVLVMKEQVNYENIANVRSLFVLSRAFSRQIPGFAIGTTIVMREVGVRFPRGQELKLPQKNQLRQESDTKNRNTVLGVLNHANIKFSERDLLVLAQPGIDEGELYWKSIEDFLNFAAVVASERANISGQSLIDLFDAAKPSILQINDFSNPSLPFGAIMEKIATHYLTQACTAATAAIANDIRQYFRQLNSSQLRSGVDPIRVRNTKDRCMRDFETKANALFVRVLNYAPQESLKQRESLTQTVDSMFRQEFLERCVAIVLPELQSEILSEIKSKIANEMRDLSVVAIGSFSFSNLSARQEQAAESEFRDATNQVDQGLVSGVGFRSLSESLRRAVSDHVKEIEKGRKSEYAAYQETEQRRQAAEAERIRQAALERQQREEAERRRKAEQERQNLLRWQRQEEERRQREREDAARRAEEERQRLIQQQELERQRQEEQQRREQARWEALQRQWAREAREREEQQRREREEEARRRRCREQELEDERRRRRYQADSSSSGGCQVC
jgi:hypothetical protein